MLLRKSVYTAIAVGLAVVWAWDLPEAGADLPANFTDMGFESVYEQNVSGLQSSYHAYTEGSSGVNNVPDVMFTLSDQRVSYPSVGQVPSPGGPAGRHFDEGALGLKIEGDNILIRVAGRLDPLTGRELNRIWYGQGDMFVTVEDSEGVRQFALLNGWARKSDGAYRSLGRGYFDSAMEFHAAGGAGDTSLEGWLVRLLDSDDVAGVDGPRSYSADHGIPEGLDFRTYAQGGQPVAWANLEHTTTQEQDPGGNWQTWYIQTWEFPVSLISDESLFDIGLHKIASCGNDQIAMLDRISIPEESPPVPTPSAAVLGVIGLAIAGWAGGTRRQARAT